MKLYIEHCTLEEILDFANTLIDAHPVGITLEIDAMTAGKPEPKQPPLAKTDDEMTLHDLALYEAGRLHVYYCLVTAGLYTVSQVADVMDLDAAQLDAVRHIWESGEIVERRDAMFEMLISNAERKMHDEN